MPKIIVEGPVQAGFESAREPTEVATCDGRVLGVFTPTWSETAEAKDASEDDALSLMNE